MHAGEKEKGLSREFKNGNIKERYILRSPFDSSLKERNEVS